MKKAWSTPSALLRRPIWGKGNRQRSDGAVIHPAVDGPVRRSRFYLTSGLLLLFSLFCLLWVDANDQLGEAAISSPSDSMEDRGLKLKMVGYNEEEIEEILASPQGLSRVNSRIRIMLMGFTREEAFQLVPREKDLMAGRKRGRALLPSPQLVERVLRPYDAVIKETAIRNGLPEAIVRAVIVCESGGDHLAVSSKGAMGLMQLMPGTAHEMGVKNSFDPRQNIEGGCRYLKRMWNEFNPRWDLTLAAYNAGPSRVREKKEIPNFPETEAYVYRTLSVVQGLKNAG